MHYFGNSNKEDIHAVGLVFEPNFFRVYYYADREAKKLVGEEVVNYGSEPETTDISKLYPLYALTFNAHYTLIPNDLFDEDHAQDILSFNTESNSPNVDWNNDPGNKAKIIFERDIHSEQYLDRVLPGLQLKHGVHALLSYCRQFKSSESYSALVQNGEKYTLAVFNGDQTRYVNTIDAKHQEDVIYFLLYALKTIGVNTNATLYLLSGAADNPDLESRLKEYLPSVVKESPISTYQPISGEEVSKHWLGVHAYLCAL